MKILFHLGHPAHFHLFKNIISRIIGNNHKPIIAIKKKDVLEKLLENSNFDYINILPKSRHNNLPSTIKAQIIQIFNLYRICKKQKPSILVGTSLACSYVSKVLHIPFINVNEDDAKQVPLYSYLSYPLSTIILSPSSCNNSIWEYKSVKYSGYHELAYLKNNYFKPDNKIRKKYIPDDIPYFILRFAKLTAHHDKNISGINSKIAKQIISILNPHGNIYITSERELEPEFEKYRLDINPIDMHHILAFAKMYIGDSQTMAAEAAVLGTPSIRFNDFVGKLGYLDELEHKYGLTYGFKPSVPDEMYDFIKNMLSKNDLNERWKAKSEKMLSDKIDVTAFMVWLIENYPESVNKIKANPNNQFNFSN